MLSLPIRKLIVFVLERRDQSRVPSTSQQRGDVPSKRLIRDSTDLQRSHRRTGWPQTTRGSKPELSRPDRKRFSLGGGQRMKNGEVNSPTPNNQCEDGLHSFRGVRA